jgi:hypothetical protein
MFCTYAERVSIPAAARSSNTMYLANHLEGICLCACSRRPFGKARSFYSGHLLFGVDEPIGSSWPPQCFAGLQHAPRPWLAWRHALLSTSKVTIPEAPLSMIVSAKGTRTCTPEVEGLLTTLHLLCVACGMKARCGCRQNVCRLLEA